MVCETPQTGNRTETARQVDKLLHNLISPHLEVKLLIQFKNAQNRNFRYKSALLLPLLCQNNHTDKKTTRQRRGGKNAFDLASKRKTSREKKSLIMFYSI